MAGPLAGLTVVVDCAHGAAAAFAPSLLRRAGAEVIAIGAEPDGHNINAGCGSTHLETLSAEVTKRGADAGIAHDGDADRCLAVGADGEVIDGDQILAVLTLPGAGDCRWIRLGCWSPRRTRTCLHSPGGLGCPRSSRLSPGRCPAAADGFPRFFLARGRGLLWWNSPWLSCP